MKQEIIADLSRITEEEQAILDGKTEVEKERYSSGQKFVMDAGKLLERGKLIDIRPHTRFIRFPAHSHNYVEMIYMCQGSTVHTINGERIELKTGELLILNQNAVQEIEPAGRDDIAVNFLILPEFFDQTLRMIGAEENQLKVGEQYFEQEMLLGVYRYIEEHYREGSLSELAEELHYDFYTLSRLIRRLTGKNYTELVQNKRLTQAAYLLETTGLSVADISERVGYENMSYFHRIFKERYGISPKKYRVEKKIE